MTETQLNNILKIQKQMTEVQLRNTLTRFKKFTYNFYKITGMKEPIFKIKHEIEKPVFTFDKKSIAIDKWIDLEKFNFIRSNTNIFNSILWLFLIFSIDDRRSFKRRFENKLNGMQLKIVFDIENDKTKFYINNEDYVEYFILMQFSVIEHIIKPYN